ncbi:pre-mRNA-processing factor 39-2 isoform X2 [Rhodamnia argentea]|nr:pre-mRNA-processing factor 39-2 isoform X2 [Rhodamnia argentea]
MRLCSIEKVVDVFEQAVLSATYSVDLWVEYCHFSMVAFEDPDDVRRLFRRGLSFVGKDYLCHSLWDKYIEFELAQQQWSSLAHIYVQTLRFPTKKLQYYYDSFKKLVTIWKKEIVSTSELDLEFNRESEIQSEVQTFYKDEEIASVVGNMLGSSNGLDRSRALHKYMKIGEKLSKESHQMDEKICGFESCIRRPYFHMKPLDDNQVENWHNYLDFVEKQVDFDWAVKLYERCLIPAANYPEFWMRYVHFVETKGGRELANSALDRAVGIFLKRIPVIHAYNARFKEKIGDVLGARAALVHIRTELDTDFVEDAIMKANMEKRWGNLVTASNIYEEALNKAMLNKKFNSLPSLYVHYSQHLYLTTRSAHAAIDVLVDAIKHLPHCKLLYEELIRCAMSQEGMEHINIIETVIANALYLQSSESQVLDSKDGEDVSNLYLKYVDQCGSIYDVMRAWNWHVRKFPRSLRTSVCSQATTSTTIKSFKIVTEEKRRSCVIEPDEPLGDCCKVPLKQSVQEDGSLVRVRGDPSEQFNPGERYSSLPLPSHEVQYGSAAIHPQDSGASDDGKSQRAQNALQQSRDNSPNGSDVDLVGDEAAKEAESVQSDLTCSKDNNQSGHDITNNELMPLSLGTLSLHPQEDRTSGSISNSSHNGETSDEPQVTNEILLVGGSRETSLSNESLPGSGYRSYQDPKRSSPFGSQGCDGADAQRQTNNATYKGSHHDHYSSGSLPNQHEPANRGQSWHHDRVRTDSRFGSRGHLRRKSQHQHESSQSSHGRGKMGGRPNQQGKSPFHAATQGNPMSPHAWPMQNVQPQSFAHGPQSQLPVQSAIYPQAQMFQYPPLDTEQYGQMQNTIAYNQMWQYYYYQQQQFMQQQQQPQQQQSQHQQLSQQPYQQQQVFYHPQQQWQQQLQLNQQYQQLQVQQLLPHQQSNDYQQLQQQEQPWPLRQPLPLKPDALDEQQAEHHNQESEMPWVQQQTIQQGAEVEEEKRGGVQEAVDSASEI